ncbi:hypothetical protein ACFFGX_07260 [Azorhizophilus paspali]|uniref:Uncharacterized protein n=1 Tax=Azorhizophilus paspali TaxID=69963 RepID=A0ABV6SIQ7_AZOPA
MAYSYCVIKLNVHLLAIFPSAARTTIKTARQALGDQPAQGRDRVGLMTLGPLSGPAERTLGVRQMAGGVWRFLGVRMTQALGHQKAGIAQMIEVSFEALFHPLSVLSWNPIGCWDERILPDSL